MPKPRFIPADLRRAPPPIRKRIPTGEAVRFKPMKTIPLPPKYKYTQEKGWVRVPRKNK